MRTLVIINPAAGGGFDPPGVRRSLEPLLDGDFSLTEAPGHAVELAARAASRGYSRVVAVGGDGTIREVATGLRRGTADGGAGRPPSLGLIPVGTGNDLARSLGLPLDPEAAARIITAGGVRPLDLVRAVGGATGDERFMTNAAVAGFCGRIGDGMSAGFRRRWRRLTYPVAALRQLRDLRPYRVRLEADGEWLETRALMVIIANSRFAGGRVPFAPQARTDDGCLDLVLIEAMGPLALAGLVPRVFQGRHARHPGVHMIEASTVRLESEPPMWINLDGDTWLAGNAGFEVLPAALEVFVP
jgi:diacylglycerol kinase (ATP)